MEYVTRTKELGRIIFSAPAAREDYAGYVWIETEHGYAATERRQICHGGDFRGETVSAILGGVKEAGQKWLKERRDWQRKEATK